MNNDQNLSASCETCEHIADVRGIDLTEAKAVGAVADAMTVACLTTSHDKPWDSMAAATLAVIRNAIHRDGDDADAIRKALGLRFEERPAPQGWAGKYGPKHAQIRRTVGEWKDVTE